MGLRIEPEDYMAVFRGLSREPKFVNDIVEASEKDKDDLNRLIYTTYSGDLLSNVPSCQCGRTTGGGRKNTICEHCGTMVELHTERKIEPIAWIRAPKGVEALINPIIWMQLNRRFSHGTTKQKFEIIRWLCDTDYVPRVQKPKVMEEVEALNLPRGLNNFVRNFDEIMAKLFSIRAFQVKSPIGDPLQVVLQRYRHCVFTQYLPIPNRLLLVVEEENMGKFVDPATPLAVNAIRMMVGIDVSLKPMSDRVKENRTVKAIVTFSEFYEEYYKEILASKEGALRKHAFGTMCYWSGRAVIASITDRHDHRELHLPWGVAVSMLRLHLMSKLKRRGMGPIEIARLLDQHANQFSPLINEVFLELIRECPYMGLPCTIVRHPSLGRGSILQLFITRIHTDPRVVTIGMPIVDTPSMNADFDGDQVSVLMLMDNETTEATVALSPSKNTYSMAAPRKISGNPALSKPVAATIANALHYEHPVDPAKLAQLKQVFTLLN